MLHAMRSFAIGAGLVIVACGSADFEASKAPGASGAPSAAGVPGGAGATSAGAPGAGGAPAAAAGGADDSTSGGSAGEAPKGQAPGEACDDVTLICADGLRCGAYAGGSWDVCQGTSPAIVATGDACDGGRVLLCAVSDYCDSRLGWCSPLRVKGAPCTDGIQCFSGSCGDAHSCD